MSNYLKNSGLTPPNQREPLNPSQVQNSAGGYTFALDDWGRLERFLILGSEGGTYYATERKLTRENVTCIDRLVAKDGPKFVEKLVEMSLSGRAPKNDPALLALAVAAKTGDLATRQAAFAALPKVARTGTHLYHFVAYANELGGWGRGLKNAVARWFTSKTVDSAAYQLVKYQGRDGWTSRDVMRLAHPRPANPSYAALFAWATAGYDGAAEKGHDVQLIPQIVQAFEEAKTCSVPRLLTLITDYKLPREAIPTQHLKDPKVWEALLPHMGLTAMIRSLGTMTKNGLIAPLAEANKFVIQSITNGEALQKSRVHPIQILAALLTYSSGRGVRGSSTWTPVQPIVDALDTGFYASFKNVTPTGKNTLLALDVSGSMGGGVIAGIPGLTPVAAEAAMALVTANVEPNYHILGFSSRLVTIAITPKMRLDAAVKEIFKHNMGSTDCAQPMIWAKNNPGAKVESIATYTDNETWSGGIHPRDALKNYRQASGIAARSAVIGLTATNFTIADPTDLGSMDFVGFDAAAPAIMADFFRGESGKSQVAEVDADSDIEE